MKTRAPKALAGFYGGKDREQTVYTPQPVIDGVLRLWGHIALDPCSGPESIVPSDHRYTWPQDGLVLPWLDFTYVNPPFADLHAWIAKAQTENVESVMLAPVRMRRKWFRQYVRECAVIYLDPLAFLGHKQDFPADLCLFCHVSQDPLEVARAFRGLGELIC